MNWEAPPRTERLLTFGKNLLLRVEWLPACEAKPLRRYHKDFAVGVRVVGFDVGRLLVRLAMRLP